MTTRRSKPRISIPVLLMVSWCWPAVSYSHPEPQDRIKTLSQQISRYPKNAGLYLARGQLYFYSEQWNKALSDFTQVALLDTARDVAKWQASVLLKLSQPAGALAIIEPHLLDHADDAEALLIRARALRDLQRYDQAVRSFSEALEDARVRLPQNYLERARAQEALGPQHLAQALSGIEEGLNELGTVPALELYALELECKLERTDAALARIERLDNVSHRPERWRYRKGQILEECGHLDAAASAYRQALHAIEKLPQSRRYTPATVSLKKELSTALTRIQTKITTQDQERDH